MESRFRLPGLDPMLVRAPRRRLGEGFGHWGPACQGPTLTIQSTWYGVRVTGWVRLVWSLVATEPTELMFFAPWREGAPLKLPRSGTLH